MPGGFVTPATGDFGELFRVIKQMQRDIAEIGRPSGTQTAQAVQQLRNLIDGLLTQVNGIFSGYVQAGGNITSTGGTGNFSAGVTSVGAYNTDVVALGGSRRGAWLHVNGELGYASSSVTKKANIRDFPLPAAAFLKHGAHVFNYKSMIDIRDNPENPAYNPDLVVPFEPGHLAEELIDAGLGMFVFFDEDGTPAGINYDMFAAVGFSVVGRDHEARIAALEAQGSKA